MINGTNCFIGANKEYIKNLFYQYKDDQGKSIVDDALFLDLLANYEDLELLLARWAFLHNRRAIDTACVNVDSVYEHQHADGIVK